MAEPLIHEAASNAELARRLARTVADEINGVVADKGHCVLAVAGGKTPVAFFQALSESALPWDDVSITLTDERFVSMKDPQSNEAMIRRELLRGNAALARIVGLYARADDPEAAIALIALPGPVDIAVVGMGEDMHTLSWFPNAPGLEEALRIEPGHRLAVVRPSGGIARITLTAGAVGEAKFLHLLITGEKKRAALMKALAAKRIVDAPVRRLFDYHTVTADVYWTAEG
jgi:6-phosphogluconolactonase